MPLAPGETREVSVSQNITESVESRNASKFSFTESSERTQTSRAESEIIQKAQIASAFESTVNGEFSLVEIGTIGANTKIGTKAGNDTTKTQKSFREAVLKAATEYTREREVEVTSSTERTTERTRTGTISNPNNEITVTYLFYELQRQYEVSERLRSVAPYVFVARHVPAPHEVDVDFLLTHAWIIRKVLLEPGLGDVLDYLETEYAGDATRLDYLRDRWEVHRDLTRRLSFQVEVLRRSRERVTDEIASTIVASGQKEGLFEDVAEFFFGGTDEKTERAAQQEVAERSMEDVRTDLQDVTARLVAATDAFAQATSELADAAARHASWKLRIDQARVHVKENILWYMHAIWDHEVPDQRFFEFYDKQVLVPSAPSDRVRFEPAGSGLLGSGAVARKIMSQSSPLGRAKRSVGLVDVDFECVFPRPHVPADTGDMEWKQLVDIADLNEPIYVGNMVGFPLKEHNYLTFWMACDYLDDELGISHPDPAAELDLDAALDNIDCADLSDDDRRELVEVLADKLARGNSDSDTIVIPTGQLFVEALPGSHPVLEHFKLEHRKIDLERAAYQAAAEEVETIRHATRLLQGQLDEPTADRVLRVDGVTPTVIVDADADVVDDEPEPPVV